MTAPDTRGAITAALSNSNPIDVIEGIKVAVAREFEALDPGSTITTTDYFNHSYVPDLVVRWSDGGRAEERPVYLRFTLRAALLGQDVRALSAAGPIVLTLREDEQDDQSRETVRPAVEASPSLLLTEVPALEEAIAARDSTETQPTSPLLELVRPNIVRGARGILDSDTVHELTASASPETGDADSALGRFDELVGGVFTADAAARLRRSAEILRIGLSEDADEILLASPDGGDGILSGRLSSAELRTLIPYLLSRQDATTSAAFWSQVGSMMDVERLEEMSAQLDGLDLTPLVGANLDDWSATRAYLSEVAEDEQLARDSTEAGWRIRSGILCLVLSNWRLQVTLDRRRLRGRSSDNLSARWIDLRPALAGFDLTRISLQSASRTVDIGTADEGDVRSDVETISDSIADDFFVPSADVREQQVSNPALITTDFPRMLATADRHASIRNLSRAALQILAYRYPPDRNEYERFLNDSPRRS